MSQQITLDLPDEVLTRAKRLATLARREVAEILAEAVSVALPPLDVVIGESPSVSDLPDEEVLKLADLQLDPEQDHRLSQLLDKQQAGQLTEQERTELLALMQVYEAKLLCQAEALVEAVRRGLREQLSP
ncbi:MAG: hypothetical protein HY710_10765 [Candidatus Latescibacteria bacterium]|nr:hypothetical protein [Candidatus Latescibacterota bacterium]